MRKLLFIILCFYTVNSFSQFSIKGKVQDTKQNPIDIFNVVLISMEDSTNITGGTFYNGVYHFDKLKKQKYSIKVTSLGYIEYRQIVEIQDNFTKELSPVTLKIKELKEVTVTAHRPTIVTKADRITVNIEGSTLGESRDGIEMLQRTPGVKTDGQGNISVVGKDNVIFYIDNKRVNSLDEVKLLNPQLVKSIEIIDNPSAAYDAEGHAVILIKTIRRQEKYYVQFESGINQSKRTTGWGNVETAFSGKFCTTSLFYDYTNGNSISQEDNNSTLFNNQKSVVTNTLSNDKTHTYRITTDFTLDKKQSLSLQFDGYSSKSAGTRDVSTHFSDNGYPNFNTHMDQFGSFWGINGVLNYSFDMDTLGQKLVVLSDFKYGNSNYGSNYYNFNAGGNTDNPFWNSIKNDNRPFVFSIKADYSKPISKLFSLDAGIKYSTVESNSRTDLAGSETLLQHYITTEKNLAMYAVFNAKLSKKFDISIGLRAEDMKRNAQKEGVNYMDTTQLGFYPNVMANYNFSDNYSLGFSYSKRIKRPSFASLDPSIYKDSLFVRYGNPNLQSTDYHTFQLSLKLLKQLSLRASYNYMKNPIYNLIFRDVNQPIVSKFISENRDYTDRWIGTIIYNQSLTKKWSLSFEGAISTNNFAYTDENGIERNNNTPSFNFDLGSTVNLPFSINFDGGIKYNGAGSLNAYYVYPDWNMFFSMKRSFLNKALSCTLSVNDLFNTTMWKSRSVLSGNVIDNFYGNTRYVEFTLKYKFGKSKYENNTKRASEDERKRL